MKQSAQRARHSTHATVPLSVEALGFQALPEGAFVANETYYITHVLAEAADYHIYAAEERMGLLPCPNPHCGRVYNSPERTSCCECGTSLAGVIPIHRRFRLYEYRERARLNPIVAIVEHGLHHNGLWLPAYFVEAPYANLERHYLIFPEADLVLANQVVTPQKIGLVLEWGAQLADALGYLHQNGFGWSQVAAEHVALLGRRAMWVDFSAIQLLDSDPETAGRHQRVDVAGLAGLLYYLATGQSEYAGPLNLPPPAGALFEDILGETNNVPPADLLALRCRKTISVLRRPDSVRLQIGSCTDVGLVREMNEDSCLTVILDQVHRSTGQPVALIAVADGMGGHAAGDVASGLAIRVLAQRMATHWLVPYLTEDSYGVASAAEKWLIEAVQAANQAVYAQRNSAQHDMGTTLVAALVLGDTAYISNTGDSRAYLLNLEGIQRLTTDHSLVERLVTTGQITSAEARLHPQRNVIYRVIGDQNEVEADHLTQQLRPGDTLLLCSDGLTSKLEDDEIWRVVQAHRSPQEACEELVRIANERGGEDNITVIIARLQ